MAGRIPQEFFDHLLGRTDIVELIDKRISLRKAGRNYMACCPFHNEKTPSFTVSPDKQFYHCFGCGAHGNAISFLMDYERLEFLEAIEELAQTAGLEIPRQAALISQQQHGDLFAVMTHADQFFRRQLRQHPTRNKAVDYLRGRGLDGETVKAFGIGYAPAGWDNLLKALSAERYSRSDLVKAGLVIEREHGGVYDRFRERIMFPIQDRRGRTIAFGGRALSDEETPKYLNSPETALFHKGQELYGLYQARSGNRALEQLLIVEGYMDVVALAQNGINNAVATLGTATTPEHLERLFRACHGIIFCFDGDRAGRDAAWRALENTLPLMREGRRASFLFLPDKEDPDSLVRRCGREEFNNLLNDQALSLSDYLFQQLTEKADMSSMDGRSLMAEKASSLIRKMPESLLHRALIERLAHVVKLPAAQLKIGTKTEARTAQPVSDADIRRTLPRRAIALLLKEPKLAHTLTDTRFLRDLKEPGVELLTEIVELIRQHTQLNDAMLFERYRDTDTGRVLSRLRQWQPVISSDLFEAEFLDVMQQMKQKTTKHLYDHEKLLKWKELSEEERQDYIMQAKTNLRESKPT